MKAFIFFITLLGHEAYYIITYPFLSLFIKPKKSTNGHAKHKVLLVESWFQSNPYHVMWMNYLEKRGLQTSIINFPIMTESFSESAKKLDAYIQKHKLTDFTLVGISNGALVCLYYLHHYKGWENIKHFISIGAPFRGTKTAMLVGFTKKGSDMLPHSLFLKELISQPVPKEKMTTVSAEIDEFVPKESSIFPGVRSYTLKAIGHNNFHLEYQQTYDLIANIASR